LGSDEGIGGQMAEKARTSMTHHRSKHLSSNSKMSTVRLSTRGKTALPHPFVSKCRGWDYGSARAQVTVECDKGEVVSGWNRVTRTRITGGRARPGIRKDPHLPNEGRYGPRDMWATGRSHSGLCGRACSFAHIEAIAPRLYASQIAQPPPIIRTAPATFETIARLSLAVFTCSAELPSAPELSPMIAVFYGAFAPFHPIFTFLY
jgi:hypothetical protein